MTFEDVKRIRQNPISEDCDNEELSKMIDVAIEKQIPKKLKKVTWVFKNENDMRLATQSDVLTKDNHVSINLCPNCKERVMRYKYLRPPNDKDYYCKHCGQALDWSDTE